MPATISADTGAQLFSLDERISKARAHISDLSNRMAIATGAASEERIADMLTNAEVELFNLLATRKKLVGE